MPSLRSESWELHQCSLPSVCRGSAEQSQEWDHLPRLPVALLGDGSCQHHPGTRVSSSEPMAEDGHRGVFPEEGVLQEAESFFPSAWTVKGAFFKPSS